MIKEPKKIYLDTNIIERYFKRSIQARKKKEPLTLPEIFHYFKIHPEIKLFTSIFTFAELFEHLWKVYRISPTEIVELSQGFFEDFNIEMIFEFHIKAEIIRWVRKFRLEAKDVLHLSIARKKKLYLLTADDDLLERGRIIYDLIKSDKELLSGFNSF